MNSYHLVSFYPGLNNFDNDFNRCLFFYRYNKICKIIDDKPMYLLENSRLFLMSLIV